MSRMLQIQMLSSGRMVHSLQMQTLIYQQEIHLQVGLEQLEVTRPYAKFGRIAIKATISMQVTFALRLVEAGGLFTNFGK
ncbi:hypothetical protein NQZ68_026838 [Dissostichus eleginoides]|nr:hypothetical protein NQZ68_026838 [Dissostichus eleginoides]